MQPAVIGDDLVPLLQVPLEDADAALLVNVEVEFR